MEKLIDLYPGFYKNSPEFCALQEIFQEITEPLFKASEELTNQMFLDSATWGLSFWEKLTGVSHALLGQDEEKRGEIRGILRSDTPPTLENLKKIAGSFNSGNVEISADYANNTLNFKFVDIMGIPSNFESFKRVIRRVVPADYEVLYEFKYNKWADVEHLLYAQAETMTWGKLSEKEFLNEVQ